MSDSEPEEPAKTVQSDKRKGAKPNEKQMAGLRKGMEALKAKREAIAKEREEFEEKQKKGEIPADAPKPKPFNAPKKPKVVVVPSAPAEPEVVYKKRKEHIHKLTCDGGVASVECCVAVHGEGLHSKVGNIHDVKGCSASDGEVVANHRQWSVYKDFA